MLEKRTSRSVEKLALGLFWNLYIPIPKFFCFYKMAIIPELALPRHTSVEPEPQASSNDAITIT